MQCEKFFVSRIEPMTRRVDITMLNTLSVERFESSRVFLGHYIYSHFNSKSSHIFPCTNSLQSSRSPRGLTPTLALNTDGFSAAGNNEQQGEGEDNTPPLGEGTRLGRIVGAGGRQLLSKLNSARKNFPTKVFLLLLGFYTANALATILGQTGDWDVLVAGVVVAAIEGIGALMYRNPPFSTGRRFQSLIVMINYWKAGVCLGLFVDAFKLGS